MSATLAVLCIRGIDGSSPTMLSPGVLISRQGDAFTFAFSSTSAAASCAIAAIERLTGAAIGIDVGEIQVDADHDAGLASASSGSAVVRAAALAASAKPGQCVITEVTALLLRDSAEVVLHPIEDRPGVHLLSPPRPAALGGLALGLPRQIAYESRHPFVERPSAWAALRDAWSASCDGPRRVVFVGAEAGAGKTRLLTEFARHVAGDGAIVLYGGSSEDVELPFQPFVEALRPLLDAIDPVGTDALLPATGRDDLARLVPSRLVSASPRPQVTSVDGAMPVLPDPDRHWAFEALVDLLRGVTRHAPVLLLLDDLHWAARPTVRLLEHVLRSGRLERVCIVAAYRDTPAEQSGAFAEALGNLCRRPGVQRLSLTSFDETAIRLFISAAIGLETLPAPLEPLVAHLVDRTAGNPFLVAELWRHLLETSRVRTEPTGWVIGTLEPHETPVSVREVTNHRLARLPPACRSLLELGACIGMTFEIGLVAAAARQSASVALDLLSQAVGGGLLAETAPNSFAFAHALVREAIEEGLTAAERRSRHQAIARTFELQGSSDEALLAHHFAAAVPLEPSSIAVFHARAAAARSLQTVSFDEAITVLLSALAVTGDDLERADLLLDLGLAYARSGTAPDAVKVCFEAAAIARQANATDRLVRAANIMAEATWRGALPGGPAVTLLQEALELPSDKAATCTLLSGLSAALAFAGRDDDSATTGDAAIALATELGEGRLLTEAIHDRLYTSMTPDTVRTQLDLARRGLQLAADRRDLDGELRLSCKVLIRLLVLPDPPALRRIYDRQRRLADQLRQPYYLLFKAANEVTFALAEGRFAEAEEAAERYQGWAEINGQAESGYGIQMFSIRREQGRLAELRPMLELALRLRAGGHTWAPGLAALYAEVGMITEAGRVLDRLAEDGLASLPRDSLLPGVLSYVADAAFAVRHRAAALLALPLLAPYSGLLIYVPGLACYGAADRYLGRLCDTIDQRTRARRHYESALVMDERTGWTTWIAHSRHALGRHLAESGQESDRPIALDLLTGAQRLATDVDMRALAERCGIILGQVAARSVPPRNTGMTPKELEVLRLVAVGRSNRQIGETLCSSQHTVANHVRAILAKIGCANRTQAAAWAHEHLLPGERRR
jgi:DNA-binding CsgD family transcriptional regulator/tetratricopeptide (TPR) repeat protein